MTDKEIRIISRKKQELIRKISPVSLFKFMATKEVAKEELEDNESIKSQIESVEAVEQIMLLDELMGDIGYVWNYPEKLYVEKPEKKESYSDAWDAVAGKKEESEDDAPKGDDGHNCDGCPFDGNCPTQKAKGGKKTIIHHHDGIKDKKIKDELLNDPDLTITLKEKALAIKGNATTGSLICLVCELLKIISKSGHEAIKSLVFAWNEITDDRELRLAMSKEAGR